MTVKSQLNACRDSLIAGMRAAARGAGSNEQAVPILRACLDLVEYHLTRQSTPVTTGDVDMTLAVLEQAAAELQDETAAVSPSVVSAVRNAVERMQSIRAEIEADSLGEPHPRPVDTPKDAKLR